MRDGYSAMISTKKQNKKKKQPNTIDTKRKNAHTSTKKTKVDNTRLAYKIGELERFTQVLQQFKR